MDNLEIDDKNDDHDLKYDNYDQKSDAIDIPLNIYYQVHEKNVAGDGSVETKKSYTKITNLQLPWQPLNKNHGNVDEVSNETVSIPIIEVLEDSLEIDVSTKQKHFHDNNTTFEATHKLNTSIENIGVTTGRHDIIQEPMYVSRNKPDQYTYANENEEKLSMEDYPKSDDYTSIENYTFGINTITDKNGEDMIVFTTNTPTDDEMANGRTQKDNSDPKSDEKINKSIKSTSKVSQLSREGNNIREINENIIIVTSPDGSKEQLALNINREQFKSLSIVTRVSVSEPFNQSSEYALRDYHHELKSVEIEEELKDDDDDVADSEEINRPEDKMLANNKFVVKFKHKNTNNDKVTLNETLTPMNNYKSIHTTQVTQSC
ncbi:hypothetical protein HW555_005621 [Spodoptera exigua]|uniref:Uncharacterized protein n=1 Tax=Spodoptera exigua TaxID=7107 RepID=A0A835LAX6_SPOEX|nr:hypothetical protein HW555_005621 [Spodoptera exigua]